MDAEGRGGANARVTALPLTRSAWAPYGWLPTADTDPRDGEGRLHYEWADPHVNVIAHARNEVPAVPGGLRCEMLYRHATHTQVLMPLDNPCVIAVARAGSWPTGAGAGMIEAFVLRPQQSLVLAQGTWHWGPFPVADDEVHLFNVQGLGYAEDNEMADLAGSGRAVDVLLTGGAARRGR